MSSYNALYPDQRKGKDVYLQGSRQMDSVTRQYYERSLGAGMFVSPMTENGLVGYSEPFRRFVQHEGFTPQVNEIENTMPSWIPGEDHLIDFQTRCLCSADINIPAHAQPRPSPRPQHKLPLERPATQSLVVVLNRTMVPLSRACMNTSRHTCRRARLSPFVVSG